MEHRSDSQIGATVKNENSEIHGHNTLDGHTGEPASLKSSSHDEEKAYGTVEKGDIIAAEDPLGNKEAPTGQPQSPKQPERQRTIHGIKVLRLLHTIHLSFGRLQYLS